MSALTESTLSPDQPGNGPPDHSLRHELPGMVSGLGQYHTNEEGANKRQPYLKIDWAGIREMVDEPPSVEKQYGQWFIPSSQPSRGFKHQEAYGQFWVLWADIDNNQQTGWKPPPLARLVEIVSLVLGDADVEVYTSRSATQDNQKARVLVPLDEPLSGADWMLAQQVLSSKLEALGVETDHAAHRAAQLCYLPNRGDFYECKSVRNGYLFNPHVSWAKDLAAVRRANDERIVEAEKRRKDVAEGRSRLKPAEAPDAIGAFNQCYTVEEILLRAGYAQSGNTFRHPNSQSGSYSASVKDGRVHSLSSNDPLYTGGGGGGAHDAFSAFAVLFAEGSIEKALKLAGDEWLLVDDQPWNEVRQREYAARKEHQKGLEATEWHVGMRLNRFRLLTPDELAAMPPIRWRVRGVLPEAGIAAVYGPPGCGKSFLMLDLLAHVASGEPWFDRRCHQGPVVYIGLEGEAGISQRVKAWRQQNGDLPEAMRVILSPLDIRRAEDRADLVEGIRAAGLAGGVLCLDTLNRATPGMDENSSSEMGQAVSGAKALQAALGGVVLLVHHSGKDTTKGLRGHSSLLAALDAAIEVSRNGDHREWHIGKAKDGEDGKSYPFRLAVLELGEDEDGELITSCVIAPEPETENMGRQAKIPVGGNQRIVWNCLQDLFKDGLLDRPEGAPAEIPFGQPCVSVEDAVAKARDRL